MALTVGQLRDRLAECGDGLLLTIDGRTIDTVQVVGPTPSIIDVITDPPAAALERSGAGERSGGDADPAAPADPIDATEPPAADEVPDDSPL